MAHDQQSIEQPERNCRHNEEVHCDNAVRMVAKERLPSLRGRAPPPRHVLGDAGLADVDAELEKLSMDSWRSPQRVGDAHLADQPANFQRHGWSTAAASRFPAPIQSETGAVPADHGLGPDDLQSIQHARCQPIQPGKYQTVDAGKGYSLRRFTSQNVKL